MTVRLDGSLLELTAREFLVLRKLPSRKGQVMIMALVFPIFIALPYQHSRSKRIDQTDKSLAIAIAHTSTRQLVAKDSELDQILAQPKWYIIYDRWRDVMHRSDNAPEFNIQYDDIIDMTAYAALLIVAFGITALSVGWWMAGRSLSPIQSFARSAKEISQSKEFTQIDLTGTEHELRDLGEVLNGAFKRMHHALQQHRHLTADVSH